MHCAHCGVTIVPVAARFCWNCGQPLQGGQPAAATTVPALETCDIAVMTGTLNKGYFQANARGAGHPYIAGKSPEFNMLSSDAFWLNQSDTHAAHERLLTQLEAAGWEQLGTTGSDWWSTTFRRAVGG